MPLSTRKNAVSYESGGPHRAITPLTHVGFQGARHLHPERLPSAKRERPVSIRLLDANAETIVNVQRIAQTIRRMTASGLLMKSVPDYLISDLSHLEKLDLSFNRLTDTGLPDSIQNLENLVELTINNNNFTKIPSCLKKLKSLSRLNLSYNKLESTEGLEKLKKLCILVLDNNRLITLTDILLIKKLEILHVENNNIRELSSDVRNLKALKDIDFSNNKLTALPAELFLLPNLEALNASQNRISKVPHFNIKIYDPHWLRHIDLSENMLTKVPEHLLLMTIKVDLSCNKIRTLSGNVIRRLDWRTDQELILDDNPLISPPAEICSCGLRSLVQYLQEARSQMKMYQGIKVIVCGSYKAGKTSLVQTLVDQQPRLEESHDGSAGINNYQTAFEFPVENEASKSLQLNIIDLSGHPFYLYPHYFTCEQPAIFVLAFNMSEYSEDRFQDDIGAWIDWIIAKNNKLVLIVVGTQMDKLSVSKCRQISRVVEKQISSYLEEHRSLIKHEMDVIEERPHISTSLSDQLKCYMTLLQANFSVHDTVISTSALKFKGFDKLCDAIVEIASDTQLFPDVLREIPTFWVDVENYLEDKGFNMVIPIMPWESYAEEISRKFGMKHLLESITQYLHDVGKVLWFSNIPSLKDFVFIRPTWLFDIFRLIMRHDLHTTLDYNQSDSFRSHGFNRTRFQQLKKEFLEDGVVEKDFLKCILCEFVPVQLRHALDEVIILLLDGFEVGYPVAKVAADSQSSYSFSVHPDEEGMVKVTRILLPWFRQTPEPKYVRDYIATLIDHRKLTACYKFPRYFPPGLFELICVRAHGDDHGLTFLSHWGDGIHAKHTNYPIRVLIRYCLQSNGETILCIDAVNDCEEDPVELPDLWSTLLPLLTEVEKILQRYQGKLSYCRGIFYDLIG